MPDKKSLDQLRLEKERAELRLAQEQRRLIRLENRKQYYEKGERAKRTHELCNIGGTVESLAPVFKGLPKQEMYELLETVFSLRRCSTRSTALRTERRTQNMALFHFTAARLNAARGSLLWLPLLTVPAKSSTAPTMARTATTPERKASSVPKFSCRPMLRGNLPTGKPSGTP